MTEPVKSKRPYDSPRRREQAADTAAKILNSAQRLFERHGYAATTMAMVAEETGVSLKTVYLAFATKSGLIRALWDVRLRGPEDVPVAEQPWYLGVITESEPQRRLRLNAHNSTEVKIRIGPVLQVIRDGAPVDADVRALWDLIQADFYENQRVIVQGLSDAGALRPELDATRATDILWTLVHPDVWQLLVVARGWTPDDYQRWLGDASCWELLG